MKHNIFCTPVWIKQINPNNIIFKDEKKFKKKWSSEVLTTFDHQNFLTNDSEYFLLDFLYNTIKETIKDKFSILYYEVWENNYIESYQDHHIHPGSHFSFIIYKDLEESTTVFVHPIQSLIQSFYTFPIFVTEFEPKVSKNNIIIFPSYLQHYVKKTKKGVTIAGNFNIKML